MTRLDDLRRFRLFDAKVPRFTSYPPANRFDDSVGSDDVARWCQTTPDGAALSLYLHIPFCRRLCYFCACRTQGTRSDVPLARYVAALKEEIRAVRAELPRSVAVERLHFGGGTPTILSPALIEDLLLTLSREFDLTDLSEFSVEIDPTDCSPAKIAAFAAHGLSRASIGVQDFDPVVQQAIGREQSFIATERTVVDLSAAGIDAINIDLLYGLPFQTRNSLLATMEQVLSLNPSRLAVYGYAHVPWMSNRQSLIPQDALPTPEDRFALFETVRDRLLEAGFLQIGIDHFAKPDDGLARAASLHRLGRSFQGYTDDRVDRLIGFGTSAISRFPEGYAQNEPSTARYQTRIGTEGRATARGVLLQDEDRLRATVIEELMCYHAVDRARFAGAGGAVDRWLSDLAQTYGDALEDDGARLTLRPWARPLVRIIAAELAQLSGQNRRYSAAI